MPHRLRERIVVACIALILGAIAVGIVKFGSSNPVTGLLRRAAEAFASPGELLWWATSGGVFAGYPSGFSGYFFWIVGTALFWFAVTMLFLAVTNSLRARRKARQ
ncbi:MAG: hypothetical protein IPH86_14795 [bacterium]|nr:hypothetical protein [bacterium]